MRLVTITSVTLVLLKTKIMKNRKRLLVITLLFSLIISKSYSQDVEDLFREGTKLIKKSRFPEAVVKLEECLEINPEHIGCACNLGVAYAYKKESHKAAEVLEKVMYKEEIPSRGIIFFNLGSLYETINNSEEVENYYGLALHLLPYFSQVYGNLSSRYYMKGDHKKGLDFILKAHSMDSFMPDMKPEFKIVGTPGYVSIGTTEKSAPPFMYLYHSPAWYFTLAINYIRWNELDNARAEIDKAEQALDKESILLSDKVAFSQVHVYRAGLHLIRRDFDKAFEEYYKGYKINSDDLGAICGVALIYLLKHDYDSALKYYYLGTKINPDFPGIVNLRKALMGKGKL
jgi:tetratricopeptide (TPR) repeat protein